MSFLSAGVFEDRLSRIRTYLDKENLAALMVLTPDNFQYVTGFFLDVAPWERPVAAVIPKDSDPFLVMNELSTNHVRMARERGTIHVEDISFWREHPSSSNRTYTRLQWTELLARKLRERGVTRGVIATDAGFAAVQPVTDVLPKLAFQVDAELLKGMRLVKHPEELELVRQGATLSDYGQSVYRSLVKPGKLMAEVDSETVKQMRIEGASRFPESKLEVRVSSLTGPASASPHGTGADSNAVIEEGHGIVNIIIVRLNGYVTENERTWFVGAPSDRQADAFTVSTNAQKAAIKEMYTGNTVSAIDAAAQTVIEAGGYGDNIFHRTGHGIGLAGHEYPDDTAFNHRELMEGEVYSAEPGIYIYGLGGFRHDDTVIVGAEPEVVTKWSKELEDQTIPV